MVKFSTMLNCFIFIAQTRASRTHVGLVKVFLAIDYCLSAIPVDGACLRSTKLFNCQLGVDFPCCAPDVFLSMALINIGQILLGEYYMFKKYITILN